MATRITPTTPRTGAAEPTEPGTTGAKSSHKCKGRAADKASRARRARETSLVERAPSPRKAWAEFADRPADAESHPTTNERARTPPRVRKGLADPPQPGTKTSGGIGDAADRVAQILDRQRPGKTLPATLGALQTDSTMHAYSASTTSASPSSTSSTSGLTPEQQAEADAAIAEINASGQAIDRAEGTDARRQATLEAARTLEEQLAGKDPAVQAAILAQCQGTIGAIADHLGELKGDQTREAIGSLTRATESVGRDNAALITDAIAPRLQASLDEHRNNLGELQDAIQGSIEAGDGALFGASLTNSLQAAGETNLAAATATATSKGIDAVCKAFEEAQGRAEELDGQLAMVVNDWQGNFSEEAVQAGIEAYRAEHAEDYEAAARAAETMASTLEGAGLIQDSRAQLEQLPDHYTDGTGRAARRHDTHTTDAADRAFAQLPRLGQTEAGSAALNDAVNRQAEGATTFLDAASAYGERLEGDERTRYQDGLNSALGRAATYGAEQLAAAGRTDEIPQLMERYADASGDPAFRQVYRELGAESQRLVDEGYSPAEFAIAFAGAAQKVADKLYPEKADGSNDAMRGRIQALGAGISTAAFLNDPSIQTGLQAGEDWAKTLLGSDSRVAKYLQGAGVAFDAADFIRDPSVENGLNLIGSASGLGSALTKTWQAAGGMRGLAAGALGKASVFVGVALSAWDTYGALKRGDELGAAAAAAPAVGAGIGAAIGVWGCGVGAFVGAGIGMAIGSLVQLGINLGRRLFGESPQEKFEKATDDFLRAALEADGLDPELAKRLRDVGGEGGDFAGVGRTITEIAEAHGLTGRDILEALEKLPDDQREDFVKILLRFPTNAEAMAEAAADGKPVPEFELTGNARIFNQEITPEDFLRELGLL